MDAIQILKMEGLWKQQYAGSKCLKDAPIVNSYRQVHLKFYGVLTLLIFAGANPQLLSKKKQKGLVKLWYICHHKTQAAKFLIKIWPESEAVGSGPLYCF